MAIPASRITEVIEELDKIIEKSLIDKNRMGLFAALYRKVTQRVQEGIAAGRFDDGDRMERLDVVFANRYLEAYQEFANGQAVTSSWHLTFEASKVPNMLLIQHLLAGINAHISLDLGIASAHVAMDRPLANFEKDFNEINLLLADLIDSIQNAMSRSLMAMAAVDWIAGKLDEKIARFSLEFFRKRAWHTTTTLYELSEPHLSQCIIELDRQTTKENLLFTSFGGSILTPSLRLLAWTENRKVVEIIQAFNAI